MFFTRSLLLPLFCFPFASARSGAFKRQATAPNAGDWYTRNLHTVRSIYDMTVYPNNLPIIMQGGAAVPPGLFDVNATGRVSPVGDFEGFEDSIEYFFALAPVPQATNLSTAIYDAQIVDFVSGCPDVAASLVYLRTGSVSQTGQLDKSRPTSTLSQVAFWRFNPEGAVLNYQAWIPNLQAWTRINTGINYDSMQVQQAAAQGLCPVVQQRCTGANQQFSSVQDCAAQLGQKPFGNFDEAWGDNVACRTIHIILTQVRPDVHCPHVGPTGGGKCVDIDYSVDYFNDEELFQAPLGSVFNCGAPLQPDNQVGAGPGAAKILQELAAAMQAGQMPGGAGGMPPQGMGGAGAGQMPPQAMAAVGGVAQNPAQGAVPGQIGAGGSMPPQTANGQLSPAMAMPGMNGVGGSRYSHSAPAHNAMPAFNPAHSSQAPNAMVPGMMNGGSCVCPSYQGSPDGMPNQAAAMPASQPNVNMPAPHGAAHSYQPYGHKAAAPAAQSNVDVPEMPAKHAAMPMQDTTAHPEHHAHSPPHVGGPVNGQHPPAPHVPKPQAEGEGPHHFKWKA